MPIRKGSISCSRFLIEGGIPKDTRKWLTHALKKSAFEPINPKTDEERGAGFVEFEDENATTWSTGLFEGDFALFAWRIDKIRIPGASVRAELAEYSRKYEAKHGRPPSRGQKNEQKELIRRSLRNKTPAVTKVHDVSIQLKSKHVLVWASATGVVEEVQGALELGLAARLLPCTPQQNLGPSVLETLAPTPELFGSVP
jgi:DNA recombination-dependent growth factor C